MTGSEAPPDALVATVEALIDRIRAIHREAGRAVAERFKRARKGRAGLEAYASFGLPIPEDFRALYWTRNGAQPPARTNMWESAVLLGFHWSPIDALIVAAKIARLEDHAQSGRSLVAFTGTDGVQLALCPELARGGETPLIATLPWGRNAFIAFDSTLGFLRSVVAAHEAGAVRFAGPLAPGQARDLRPDGRPIEPGETLFDVAALWRSIRALNPRADYWTAQLDGPLDWGGAPPPPPEDGRITLRPEVHDLVFGDLKRAAAKRLGQNRLPDERSPDEDPEGD